MLLCPLQVTVSSLHEVVKYFQERTEYRLLPYSLSELYDTQIGQSPTPRFLKDPSSLHFTASSLFCAASDLPTAPGNTRTPSVPVRVGPRGEVAPSLQPNATGLPPPEAVDGYMCPDSHITDDFKLGETRM